MPIGLAHVPSEGQLWVFIPHRSSGCGRCYSVDKGHRVGLLIPSPYGTLGMLGLADSWETRDSSERCCAPKAPSSLPEPSSDRPAAWDASTQPPHSPLRIRPEPCWVALPACLTASPFSLTGLSPNKIVAGVIPSWHVLSRRSRLIHLKIFNKFMQTN